MNSRTQQSGFTAVELLITLFVAAAFIVAGYQLFNIVMKDGGETRAESRAGNVAYDYLRRYSDAATNPCAPSTPFPSQSVSIDGLLNPTITVQITCPSEDAPSLSKAEATITYNNPAKVVKYATYVDKSKGGAPISDFTDGLIARWKFNGDANGDVGGANGSIFGATPAANRDGDARMAYSFNAANQQYIRVPSTFGVTDRDVSVALWVYTNSSSTSGQFIKVGDSAGFAIGVGGSNFDNTTPGGKIIALFEGVRWIDTGVTLGTGWHHLVLVLNNTGVPLVYRDGVLVGTFAGANTQIPNANGTAIGGRDGRWTNSAIDDVRIYGRVLTASEIFQIYGMGPK